MQIAILDTQTFALSPNRYLFHDRIFVVDFSQGAHQEGWKDDDCTVEPSNVTKKLEEVVSSALMRVTLF